MRAGALLRALGPIDLYSLLREPLLRWMVVLPLGVAALVRLGRPAVAAWLAQYGYSLDPYSILLGSFFVAFAPSLAGMVVGFLLLDERDNRTLTALLVTPLSIQGYLAYRIAILALLGALISGLAVLISGLARPPLWALALVALLAALSGPVLALFLAAFAENKVAGFALVKVVGGVNLVPIASYFLPPIWQFPAGLVPTYWPLRAYWVGAAGGANSPVWWLLLAAGLGLNLLALLLLARRFAAVVHR